MIHTGVTTDGKNIRLKCLASGKSENLASPDKTAIEYVLLDLFACCYYIIKRLLRLETIRWSLDNPTTGTDVFRLEPLHYGYGRVRLKTSDTLRRIQAQNYLTTVDITTKTVHEFELKVKEGSLELEDENSK